jgi:hypothetical protein
MKFTMKSILKPSESVMVATAGVAVVYGIYQMNMPSMTEVHGAKAHNPSVGSSQKKAMWGSAATVSALFLLTKDATVFTLGGLMFLYEEWSYRHANSVNPQSGKVQPLGPTAGQAMDMGSYTPDSTQNADPYGSYQ